ncbi:RNA polymerase sigma-70 factor [Uliginosibacterium sp. sgz301328]|uniref:RNA polymerase sigma-70 factor n=1 Tax=Uliginosibacterium sp. sgz301328 TaxID=3243764 RepID=UPI00359E3526
MAVESLAQNPFPSLRGRLFGIAYRMLGSRADADDIVQEAWLRWNDADQASIASADAWLVTVTTRLSIDRLRRAQAEREHYTGPWLPEPIIEATVPPAEHALERASDVSLAFLTLLERLAPEERAAYLLREVFDYAFSEVAEVVGKTEAACRKMVSRARTRVQAERPRFDVSAAAHMRLLERFMVAARSGKLDDLRALFAEDALLLADGGGRVESVLRPIRGADRLARLYHVVARRLGERAEMHIAIVNGEPGIVRTLDGRIDTIIAVVTDGERITALYSVRNPEKLRA